MRSFFTAAGIKLRAFIFRYSNKRTIAALLVVIAFLAFGVLKALLSTESEEDLGIAPRQVQVAPAGALSELDSVFESTGEVKSRTQGDLRVQSAGIVTNVNYRVGQKVEAGTIIGSVENASQRAAVAQAQAGVAQALATRNKVVGGTREEQLAVLATNTQSAERSLIEALIATRNALLSIYTTTNRAFTGGVDVLFDDADGANPQLLFTSTKNTQLLTAEHERLLLQNIIERHVVASTQVSYYDSTKLREEMNTVEEELRKLKSMLDSLVVALDGAVAGGPITNTSISTYKAIATEAQASVLSALTTLSSTRGVLNNTEAALVVAQKNEAQGVRGAQQEDIDAAEAQLSSAKATLAQAVAQLEKTRVRAPVTGVVTILNIEPGDFVTSFQDVGLVANNESLEIQTYVSSSVVDRIRLGGSVTVGGAYPGIVTSIAPGVDPVKRQIEVRVALIEEGTPMLNGTRTTVVFLDSGDDRAMGTLRIPISALKLVGDSAFVFTVGQNSTLEARRVQLGKVIQSAVEILAGIDRTTTIVLDSRGLNDGDKVVIAN
tara:strand:+ start:34271 stop:35917 length:1647 start_codon:yes stop_codon:yes gene_type:complete